MRHSGHLTLHELKLAPSEEYAFERDGWCFVRAETGVGYALAGDTAVSLSEGDSIVFFKQREVTIRASQLSELDVQFFWVCTELLAGFFPLSDQHFFEKAALDAKQNFRHFPRENIVSQEFGELRLRKAQELLSHSNLRIAKIAKQSGFHNVGCSIWFLGGGSE